MADVRISASKVGFESAVVVAVTGAMLLWLSRLDASAFNNYVVLADAFVHGHVWIDWPGPRVDAVQRFGVHYVIEGPMPALLLVPFVAVFGQHVNQTAFTCVCGALLLGTAWYVARRFPGIRRDNAALLVAFFAFGTDLAWCSMYGAVWFTAHVVADMFVFFALVEVLGRKRPWVVLLLLLCAAETRFALVLAIVPLVPYALSYVPRERLGRALGLCAAVAVPFAVAYVWYDFARWGVWNDIGYSEWYHGDQIGQPTGSPFRLEYVPGELEAFFTYFPTVVGRYPWLVLSYSSVPITLTSPALVVAFFARGERRLIAALGAAALLTFVPNVLYYANGGAQFGMRHALDFEPFLYVLMVMALAQKRIPQAAFDLLCAFSIFVGLYGIWFWRTFYDDMLTQHVPGVN